MNREVASSDIDMSSESNVEFIIFFTNSKLLLTCELGSGNAFFRSLCKNFNNLSVAVRQKLSDDTFFRFS